jgi:hypothetical protein
MTGAFDFVSRASASRKRVEFSVRKTSVLRQWRCFERMIINRTPTAGSATARRATKENAYDPI